MAYTKNVWKDRQVEYPNRYTDQNGNVLTLTPNPGTVTQAGTIVNAERMNNIEQGIEDAHNVDNTMSSLSTNPVQNNTIKNYVDEEIRGIVEWTNSSLTTEFSSQTINVNFSDYSYYEILYVRSTVATDYVFSTGKIPTNKLCFLVWSMENTSRSRMSTSIDSTSITFDNGYTGSEQNNKICIPWKIVCYKHEEDTKITDTDVSNTITTLDEYVASKKTEIDDYVAAKEEVFDVDTTEFVRFTDYASSSKAGVVSPSPLTRFKVDENGCPYAETVSKEDFDLFPTNGFLSRGTFENMKETYVQEAVQSSTVQDELVNQGFAKSSEIEALEDSLDNIVPKNSVSGESISIDDALEYRMLELSINGESDQDVTTQGKNLFDINQSYINGIISGKTGVISEKNSSTISIIDNSITITEDSNNFRGWISQYINWLDTTDEYTLSFEANNQNFFVGVFFFDEDKEYLSKKSVYSSDSRSIIFTAPSETKYVVFCFEQNNSGTSITFSNIQLEKGSEATEYEVFIPNSPSLDYPSEIESVGTLDSSDSKYYLNLSNTEGTDIKTVSLPIGTSPLRKIGDYADKLSINTKTGVVTKTNYIGEVVLDGSETIKTRTNSSTTHTKFIFADILSNNIESIYNLISSHFTAGKANDATTSKNCICGNSVSNYEKYLHISIDNNIASTIDELKTWLSSNNVTVDYVLATPTTEEIATLSSTELAKLKTYAGTNNITTDDDLNPVIDLTYALDIKKYYDNKIAELQAQTTTTSEESS